MTTDLSQNVRPVGSEPEADRAAAFTARVLGDTAATATVALAALGDRLGLFASLATDGPATSGELAARTGTEERYVREWAGGLVAAGYLERDAVDSRIALPPAHLPDVLDQLRGGARVADVGCGAGLAAVALAQAFPQVIIVGYDAHPPVVERARAAATAAGVADRVTFHVLDAAGGLPERFDVITTFDVVHDAVDPQRLLTAIHDALVPGGIHVCLEINCADRVEDNVGPVAALLYGFSVLYCMTTSLAHGGAGLGTLGLPPARLRRLAGRAGFARVRQVELDNPFNNLYELWRAA